jgi:curved DNA-binding protein
VKDLYSTLGVGKTADAAEIKRAYRKLTQQYHPDKNPGDKGRGPFKEVSSAYEVLSDADKRKNYDEFGDMSLTQGFDAERARAYKNATRGGGGRRPPRRRGPAACGFDESMFNNIGDARGTSFDDLLSQLFGGGRVVDPFAPAACRGRGPSVSAATTSRARSRSTSWTCCAASVVPLRIESESGGGRTLDVKVPAGIADGGKLRLRGQGGRATPPATSSSPSRSPAPSPQARRPAPLAQPPRHRARGLPRRPRRRPDPGGTVTLKLKPGSQNGQTLRLKGKGIASPGQEPGDLLVTLDVRLPAARRPELLAALERLQADTDPRADLEL